MVRPVLIGNPALRNGMFAYKFLRKLLWSQIGIFSVTFPPLFDEKWIFSSLKKGRTKKFVEAAIPNDAVTQIWRQTMLFSIPEICIGQPSCKQFIRKAGQQCISKLAALTNFGPRLRRIAANYRHPGTAGLPNIKENNKLLKFSHFTTVISRFSGLLISYCF